MKLEAEPMKKAKTKKKPLAREPRLLVPEESRLRRKGKEAYFAPELLEAAEARALDLGKGWSKYINDLVRADLGLNGDRDGSAAAE